MHACHKNHWNWFLNEQDMAYGSEGVKCKVEAQIIIVF
jgi:hypothetical protein